MEFLGFAGFVSTGLLMFVIIWVCVNRILWEFEDTDKPFLTWLRGK